MLADVDGLTNRGENFGAFVAHVGRIDAAVLAGDLREFHDLVCIGIGTRNVDQSGG
ncbi:hypothetical protein D3C83_278020 [compost metagenome]